MSVPSISGRKAVKAFERLGWEFVRQKGSHMILVKTGNPASLSVPDHNPVAKGTLRGLIARSGHTIQEFLDALE